MGKIELNRGKKESCPFGDSGDVSIKNNAMELWSYAGHRVIGVGKKMNVDEKFQYVLEVVQHRQTVRVNQIRAQRLLQIVFCYSQSAKITCHFPGHGHIVTVPGTVRRCRFVSRRRLLQGDGVAHDMNDLLRSSPALNATAEVLGSGRENKINRKKMEGVYLVGGRYNDCGGGGFSRIWTVYDRLTLRRIYEG